MTIHLKRFAIQKRLLILLLLADIVDWILFTLNTTSFIKANLGETLSSRTHKVFFSSLPVMPCKSVLLVHNLGLGSELVDWYRNATSVPFGHFLIDLSPRTDDRLRYCTNTGSIPLKFYIPDRLKQSKILDDEHTKSLYTFQVFQSFSHKCKSFLLQSCPKEFIRFLCQRIINLFKGNLQSIKRHHVVKFQSEVRFCL